MKILYKTLILKMSKGLLHGIIIAIIFSSYLIAGNTHAQAPSIRHVKISLDLENTSLPKVFAAIEAKTAFIFSYEKNLIASRLDAITIKVKNQSVAAVLEKVAKETGLSFKQIKANIMVKVPPSMNRRAGQKSTIADRIIKGKITDENGEPLSGATILIKGTTIGAVADLEGSYTISLPDDATTLVFTFIGFVPQEISIGGRNVIDVVMVADLTTLDELVVVGYGEQSRQKLTSAVSKVTAKDIENLPVTSFDQALQGIAPGVHVSSASGVPGGAVLVRIRGQSSIVAGNDPLYVIDGVPIISGGLVPSSNQNLTGQLNILSGINPEDIASIEVLKDAAATAIYGSRGANGVILITTKQGKKGRTNIRLDVMGGVSRATELLDVLNSREYLEIKREAYENDGLPIPADLSEENPAFDTDWQDEIYRTASLTQYQLSIDGGNDNTTFYIGAGFRDEQAILEGTGLERGNFRLNLNHQASEKLQFGVQLGLSREKNLLFSRGATESSPVKSALSARPDIQVRDYLGNYTIATILTGSIGSNPVEELLETTVDNFTSKLVGNVFVGYDLLPWFQFRADAGYDFNVFQQDIFIPSTTLIGGFFGGQGYFANIQNTTYNIEPTLRIDRDFGSAHHLNAVIGITFMDRVARSAAIRGQNFISDELRFLNSAGQIDPAPTTGTNRVDYSFTSLYTRFNYDYNGKYLFGATIRRDGSSRFGPENRFGTFWAVSGGWVFSDESFMDNLGWLSFGKIRASYGITGNDQIGNFANLTQWTPQPGYGGTPGRAPTRVGNPGLRWEETSQLDVGLELSFLNNRITFETDYFVKRTNDLLISEPLPGTAGFSGVTSNIGEVENRGVELGIKTINLQTNSFSWTSKLNVTQVDNEIISLVNDEPILTGFSGFIVGEPINVIRGFDFQEVDPETGDVIYRDVNEDGRIDGDDRIVIGNALADFFGGFTNSFSWKGFTLDVFFQFVNNVDRVDGDALDSYLTGGVNLDNQSRMILDRWQSPGDVTNVPKVTTAAGAGNNNNLSQRFIWDASYVRLKNLTVAYNLPTPITQNWGIQQARVYVTGTNLYTFTDYPGQDPETTSISGSADGILSSNLPQVKSFLVGLNVTF